uniref:Uncharacterized protein n=1 Tax=Proboscia inermis TaxID=420281 RepID=A0A7S0C618_9STRA|mmetsp:Transcript_26974/g.27351  ORF Transcript_26974/g.27351 Transcript_26974/m.27351 type:complete len:109 (+) Transcript_26974:725-1051(+)
MEQTDQTRRRNSNDSNRAPTVTSKAKILKEWGAKHETSHNQFISVPQFRSKVLDGLQKREDGRNKSLLNDMQQKKSSCTPPSSRRRSMGRLLAASKALAILSAAFLSK